MSTNRRLKAARVLRGLTQRQLAEQVGLQEIEVSRYETGRSCPDAQTQLRMAEVLGKPAHELFSAWEDRS
jgi:transcriptional regulator with XRE-family HTH domain